MNIAIVTHAYYPHYGGVTENVAATSRALRGMGHAVTVITAGAPGAGAEPDLVRLGRQVLVPWNGASVNFTFGTRLQGRLERIFSERRTDLVHIHCPLAPMLPLAALGAAGDRPVVGMFHATAASNAAYALFRRPLARAFARITVAVAVSEPARRFVARYFPGSYRLVPNGVDLDRFSPAPPPRRRAGEPATVLVVGRLDPRKGVEHAIDAMPALARALGPVELLVVGDGPRRWALRERARRTAPGLVRFLGAVEPAALPRLYAGAACLCAPAVKNESFGIVLLEAMASQRPIVASDIAGYRLLVSPGVNGLLVPPGDSEALAAALLRVVGDPGAARAMGAAGRWRARAFSWPEITRRLLDIYANALGAEPAPALRASEAGAAVSVRAPAPVEL